ncbi:MAG: glutamate-5-semialdehyde dehydrogenase, partial [Woeseiaceae bacterium]
MDIAKLMDELGRNARRAAEALAQTDAARRDAALRGAAERLRDQRAALLEANAIDVREAKARGVDAAML